MSPIKTITSVLKKSTDIITSITACHIGLAEILAIMSVSTFKTDTMLFLFLNSDCYNEIPCFCTILCLFLELFMLDSGDMVYLWHGWWPEGNSEVANVQTGSAQAKYNIDRSCAIQTAIEYCKGKIKYGK